MWLLRHTRHTRVGRKKRREHNTTQHNTAQSNTYTRRFGPSTEVDVDVDVDAETGIATGMEMDMRCTTTSR